MVGGGNRPNYREEMLCVKQKALACSFFDRLLNLEEKKTGLQPVSRPVEQILVFSKRFKKVQKMVQSYIDGSRCRVSRSYSFTLSK